MIAAGDPGGAVAQVAGDLGRLPVLPHVPCSKFLQIVELELENRA